ncbi:protein Gawky-like isoform X2 [Stegodyphus dumicola]|uniref:protein Gawky-like isoform X2 n=1 Tax=Stegodyphus dumicola TaxID=202533 RepID=UPI0015A82520|nr:protein Gawky-like isoform X2 [Stegodyphus dumicola]
MLCVSSFFTQSNANSGSNSQSAQSSTSFCGDFSRLQGVSPTQKFGAKQVLTETYGIQKPYIDLPEYSENNFLCDMQTNVHKMDSNSRYNNNDTSSSHGGASTFSSNGVYRSNGPHNDSSRVISQNSSYGAQFNSSVEKNKGQGYNCENDSNTESSYSGWQSLNSSVSSSSSSSNWNIPDNKQVMGRSIHGSRDNSASKEENMTIDNESSFSGLLGATGGSDSYSEEKSNGSNNFAGNSSRSGHVPRLGLLGGGESSLVTQPSNWNGSQGPTSTVSAWGGVNRQNNSSEISGNANSDMIVDGDMGFNGMLGATGGSDFSDTKQNSGNNSYRQDHAIPPPRMGLLGGGEGNMNTAPSGWVNNSSSGNPGSGWGSGGRTSTNNAASDMPGSSTSGTSPTKPQGSWAQAAGKGLNPSQSCSLGGGNVQNSGSTMPSETSVQRESAATSRDHTEIDAKDLRYQAAMSEGWGQNSVNQDTAWDIPDSPTPDSGKDNPPAVWRAPVNNGTEIWENNLRMNKGSGTTIPVSTAAAPPWGHTPATNIGGHWGDDDSTNMWSGVPQNPNPTPANWPESNTASTSNMWGGNSVPSEKHWSSNQSSWGDGPCGSDTGTSAWASSNKNRQMSNWSPITTPKKEISSSGWEPPSPPPSRRAVGSTYDDGTAVWGNPQRQGKVSHWKDMPSTKPIMNPSNNMVGPNAMLSNLGGMPPSGPGMIRLPTGNKDGTATWNKQPPPLNRITNWADVQPPAPRRDSPTINNWGEENHMHSQIKNLPNVQGGPYNVGWNDQCNTPFYWGTKPKSNSSWADGQVDTSSWLGPTKQRSEMMPPGWSSVLEDMSEKNNLKNDSKKDLIGNWTDAKILQPAPYDGIVGRKLKGGKPLCRDIVHASKQFRILTEYGFRKEDVENALRNNNMNLEEAAAELQAMSNGAMDVDSFTGRKVRPANGFDDVSMADPCLDAFPTNFHGPNNFQSPINFPGVGHSFKQQTPKGPNSNSVLNSALGGQQTAGNLSPALLQKILQQQQQQQQQQQSLQLLNLNNVQAFGNPKFPTNAQLRHLVQQIQMAVQAGHLNAQILNQPLAPQTLQFLYQLLQQIKVLGQLQQQQILQSSHMSKQGVPNTNLQLNVQIAQTKQRINNLQNQICANQALFLKQQIPQQQPPVQQQQHHGSQPTIDLFKPNVEAMHNEFQNLTLKDTPHQNHQSRLNQWKLSSLEKDENQMCPPGDMTQGNLGGVGDFSRAPGPLNSKTPSIPSSGSTLHPLLDQNESTWSGLSGRSHGDSGWPETATSSTESTNGSNNVSTPSIGNGQSADNKESTHSTSGPTSASSHPSYSLTDLVPEFEPGKPWKGTQLKNIEDDPHITPGSIARSPLSVNNIKESNLFWPSKPSPANSNSDATGSLTSSTWVFNPPTTAGPNSSTGKSGNGKNSWSSSDFGASSDLWGSISKARNPPPGLSGQGWERPYNSTFLILRNLTPQIDGSTLKTLCMQHGPLQMFHLFLNRGVALVRYSTREEASKAQSALNNCVLGNTTMLADIPSEGEIQQYLQVSSGQSGNNTWPSSQQQQSGGGTSGYHGASSSAFYSGSTNGAGSSNWNGNVSTSQLWSFSNSSLWGSGQPSNDHDASTNPMNSYLPGDLLGGEPM